MAGSKATVMIVDDEKAILSFLGPSLNDAGYRTLTATNATEALDLMSRHTIDVAVVDIKMPGISGLEFLRRLKDSGVETPVLVMTAAAEESTAAEALELGAYAYIVKPIPLNRLTSLVDQVLETKAPITQADKESSGQVPSDISNAKSPVTHEKRLKDTNNGSSA